MPILGQPDVFLSHPLGITVASCAGAEVSPVVCTRISLSECRFRHHAGNQAAFSVRTVRAYAVGVKVDRKRVIYRLDVDFLVKRILADVVRRDPPVAPAHLHSVLKRGVVGGVSVGIDFNVPSDALNDLCNLQVALVVSRMHLNARSLLALLVGHLTDVGINLVDGQARPRFKVTAVLNLHRPLVARGKLQVAQRLGSVLAVRFTHQAQKLDCFAYAGVVVHVLQRHTFSFQLIQLPAMATLARFLGLDGSLIINPMYRNASAPCEYWSCSGCLLNCPVSGSTSYR